MDERALVDAAARHWSALAAFAWTSSGTGPGAVVLHAEDLLEGRPPAMNWFAAADVPAGDDFRTLMLQADRDLEIVLVIVGPDDDIAVVLRGDDTRPTPAECARAECD